MTGLEGGNLSYYRRYRKILPNEPITAFIETAQKVARSERFSGFEEGTNPVFVTLDGLRLVQLERRVRAGQRAGELLKRVDNKLTASTITVMREVIVRPTGKRNKPREVENPVPRALRALEEEILIEEEGQKVLPPLRANKLVVCTKADLSHHGVGIGLFVDDGPVAGMLDAQTKIMVDAIEGTNAGRQLARPDEPDQPRVIPFMYGQFRSDDMVYEYMEALEPHLPVFDIHAGALKTEFDRDDSLDS